MINSIGLQNIGVRAFVQEKLPALASFQTAVFANVFGYETADYVEVVRVLEDHAGVAAYELNVSCPNTRHGGIYFSSDPALLAEVVTAVKRVARRPVIVKLSPNVAAIEPLARAAEDAGADAISLVNTFVCAGHRRAARGGRGSAPGMGGLSGPAIKPIALRMVWQAARAVKIPVIGLGGIATGEDAAEFLIAGATRGAGGDGDLLGSALAGANRGESWAEFLRREKIAAWGNWWGRWRCSGVGNRPPMNGDLFWFSSAFICVDQRL